MQNVQNAFLQISQDNIYMHGSANGRRMDGLTRAQTICRASHAARSVSPSLQITRQRKAISEAVTSSLVPTV